MTNDRASVSLQGYTRDLLAAERRTVMVGAAGLVFGFGALVLASAQATKVFAATANQLLGLHNDLIRKGEREHAATKAEMATKAEVEPIKDFVAAERSRSITTGKFVAGIAATAAIAIPAGALIANLWG
jgi:hypothetical protein